MSLQLNIDYPETLPDAMGRTREQFEREAKWAMAILLNLHLLGVAMIDLSEEELLSDLENA